MSEIKELTKQLDRLINSNKVERTAATTVHAAMAKRIFIDGKDSKNQQIGVYSTGYQKTRRRRNYPNSNKVILQATRRMVNDWVLIVQDDVIASGFNFAENFDKSIWVEETYGKDIFSLTPQEFKLFNDVFGKEFRRNFT